MILEKDESLAALGAARPLDRVAIEGELLAHGERRTDAVNLLGIAEARRHEQAAVGRPVEKGGTTRLLITGEARRERRVGRRDAIEDQVAALTVLQDPRWRDERGRLRNGRRDGRRDRRRAVRRRFRRGRSLWS